ncbi:MIT C-terminal domain-containing protein [Marinimicrobium agarilyticum]|uniref:MIT C-terminal domain-containing protein n=1 Tax=Marinimicrobium agarilyticum TaxID=306546 RepID=UPI00041DAB81|nr:MIT C-terminal domain-containing protein [Marinimicrobium agarilyticum]
MKSEAQEDKVAVHLITLRDEFKVDMQDESFKKVQDSGRTVGIDFTWEFDEGGIVHARHIVAEHGSKILLDRGLDIFQHYEMTEAFAFANRLQEFRSSKAFEITNIWNNPEND